MNSASTYPIQSAPAPWPMAVGMFAHQGGFMPGRKPVGMSARQWQRHPFTHKGAGW